jgi:O-acetyl-ADP-ribose deacetylase (regulator of RNase III)
MLADQLSLASIAFPAISTGIFGFPKKRAASVILSAIQDYFTNNSTSGLRQVSLVLFDPTTVDMFLQTWTSLDQK